MDVVLLSDETLFFLSFCLSFSFFLSPSSSFFSFVTRLLLPFFGLFSFFPFVLGRGSLGYFYFSYVMGVSEIHDGMGILFLGYIPSLCSGVCWKGVERCSFFFLLTPGLGVGFGTCITIITLLLSMLLHIHTS